MLGLNVPIYKPKRQKPPYLLSHSLVLPTRKIPVPQVRPHYEDYIAKYSGINVALFTETLRALETDVSTPVRGNSAQNYYPLLSRHPSEDFISTAASDTGIFENVVKLTSRRSGKYAKIVKLNDMRLTWLTSLC